MGRRGEKFFAPACYRAVSELGVPMSFPGAKTGDIDPVCQSWGLSGAYPPLAILCLGRNMNSLVFGLLSPHMSLSMHCASFHLHNRAVFVKVTLMCC